MKKYDVAIIGAGPCGISCAIELAKKNKEVLLIDQGKKYSERYCNVDAGNSCLDCSKCNVISGFGGCVHYGDSVKLSYYPSGKALHAKLEKEYEEILKKACNYWRIDKDKDFIKPTLRNPDGSFEIKNYPVCVMNSLKVKKNIKRWYKQIDESDYIDLKVGEEMSEIRKEKGGFQVLVENGETYWADKVVLGMGRGGMIWLKENLSKLGISTQSPISTIGLRFEMPKKFMQEFGRKHPDLKIRKEYNKRKYKTFCYCGGENGGRIKFINYGKYVLLDGHVLTEKDKDNMFGNFALLTQLSLPNDSKLSYSEYVNSLIEEYVKMNAGKPVCQNFVDFKNKKDVRETHYNAESSVSCVPYKNVYRLLGDEVQSFCYVAEEIFHYILADTDIVYEDFLKEVKVIALEMEGLWDKVETNNRFETSCKGIYIGGDCGGETQGILQATMMGIKIADSICTQ